MQAELMSDAIVARVSVEPKGASMPDLLDPCGAAAHGDLTLEFRENLVLWHGVSETFVDAFKLPAFWSLPSQSASLYP